MTETQLLKHGFHVSDLDVVYEEGGKLGAVGTGLAQLARIYLVCQQNSIPLTRELARRGANCVRSMHQHARMAGANGRSECPREWVARLCQL